MIRLVIFFIKNYLVLGQDRNQISKKNQNFFKINIKIAYFKKKFGNFKISQKSLKIDSIKIKIVLKIK